MTAPDFVAFDAPLRDGRTVHIRAIGPSDEAEVLQAFDRMSADARYMRFMRVVREPNRDRLRRALESMPSKGFGVVATARRPTASTSSAARPTWSEATHRAASSRSRRRRLRRRGSGSPADDRAN